MLAGLPDDRCPSPHWGIVLEGSLRLVHADGSVETGRRDLPLAGHTAMSEEGAVFIEVGPVSPMRQFHEHAQSVFA